MSKLYLSYIPKVSGETADFKIIKSLKKCMRFFKGKNNIISSPGYLSTSTYVKDFVNKFKDIVPTGDKIYVGYFKGMNTFNHATGSCDLIDEHYAEFLSTSSLTKLEIEISNKPDHRKMLFIFGINNNPTFNFDLKLTAASKKDFLESITVNAVLIGSSNQSYNTYYGGTSGRATKGEADVLLFAADGPETMLNDMYVEGTVIFEEILSDKTEAHQYLKDILDEFLSHALK